MALRSAGRSVPAPAKVRSCDRRPPIRSGTKRARPWLETTITSSQSIRNTPRRRNANINHSLASKSHALDTNASYLSSRLGTTLASHALDR